MVAVEVGLVLANVNAQPLSLIRLAGKWETWVILVAIVPVLEELIFRVYLLEWLRARLSVPTAVLASAVGFGLVHGQPLSVLLATAGGLIFGAAYVRTGSIWPGVIAHAGVNALGLLALMADLV